MVSSNESSSLSKYTVHVAGLVIGNLVMLEKVTSRLHEHRPETVDIDITGA